MTEFPLTKNNMSIRKKKMEKKIKIEIIVIVTYLNVLLTWYCVVNVNIGFISIAVSYHSMFHKTKSISFVMIARHKLKTIFMAFIDVCVEL